VEAVTVAAVPLNFTVLFIGVVSKFVPLIVTVAPTAALVGEKLVIDGAGIEISLWQLHSITRPTAIKSKLALMT
jgi:hypothetical protein